MKQDNQIKILEDLIDEAIIDLKTKKNNDIKKLSIFKELLKKTVDRINLINPKNYDTINLLYSTTEFLISCFERLIEESYATKIIVSENLKITVALSKKITEDKFGELENTVKILQEDRKKYQEFFDLLDVHIERLKNKEDELSKTGIYA